MPSKSNWLLAVALVLGCAIGWIDTRPGWDDTGITAGLIFLSSLGLAALRPRLALAVALVVGGAVVAFNAAKSGRFDSAPALLIALAGGAIGALVGKGLHEGTPRHPA